jgi:hypothetical protein
MREIPLTQGMVALIDDVDYDRLIRYNWSASWSGRHFYAKCNVFPYYMHRFIVESAHVDHKNFDTLDNRSDNLRPATKNQNTVHAGPKQGKKYKGVTWVCASCKWKAQIMVNYKQINLGLFNQEEDAARAYDSAAMKLRGEFAYLNFPGENSE